MISRTIAAAVLTTTLMTGVASAQKTTANKADAATVQREGEWRASKLVGVNVYNEAGEKIGDILCITTCLEIPGLEPNHDNIPAA